MLCDRLWTRTRIATLRADLPGAGVIEDAVIAAKDGRIVYAGAASDAPRFEAADIVDCSGRLITPG